MWCDINYNRQGFYKRGSNECCNKQGLYTLLCLHKPKYHKFSCLEKPVFFRGINILDHDMCTEAKTLHPVKFKEASSGLSYLRKKETVHAFPGSLFAFRVSPFMTPYTLFADNIPHCIVL